jgi:endogenous inhibitor of DNA gyrase (YacG/DUF329 family)
VRPARCPGCRAEVTDDRYRPFCSERCRLVDLSGWVSERYRIPGEPVPTRDPANDDDDA